MTNNQHFTFPHSRDAKEKPLAPALPSYCNVLARRRERGLARLLGAVSILAMAGSGALADDATAQGRSVAQPTNGQLIEKLERMEARIRSLESELHRKGEADANHGFKAHVTNTRGKPAKGPANAAEAPAPGGYESAALEPPPPAYRASVEAKYAAPAPGFLGARETPLEAQARDNKDLFGVAASPIPGLRIGAYGELLFGVQQNPDAFGQWQTGFDAQRLVLTPSYQFTDNIIFNSEIEFEHGGIAFDADDKLAGAVEVEQAYVDFRITPYVNIRAPGVDLGLRLGEDQA